MIYNLHLRSKFYYISKFKRSRNCITLQAKKNLSLNFKYNDNLNYVFNLFIIIFTTSSIILKNLDLISPNYTIVNSK